MVLFVVAAEAGIPALELVTPSLLWLPLLLALLLVSPLRHYLLTILFLLIGWIFFRLVWWSLDLFQKYVIPLKLSILHDSNLSLNVVNFVRYRLLDCEWLRYFLRQVVHTGSPSYLLQQLLILIAVTRVVLVCFFADSHQIVDEIKLIFA